MPAGLSTFWMVLEANVIELNLNLKFDIILKIAVRNKIIYIASI